MASFLLGVDGGGTKTLAVVADAHGQIFSRGQTGSSNYQVVGREAAQAALCSAIEAALASADQVNQTAVVACLGLAGVARPEDRAWVETWADRQHLAERILVVSDVELVLAAGTPAGWGLTAISGTGSIAFGRSPDGQTARAGGWGYVMGDEGSGYAMGVAALRAVARAADGRGQSTSLTEAVLREWGLDTPQGLIDHVYGHNLSRVELADLTRLVHQAALRSDPIAAQIVQEAACELGMCLLAVTRALRLQGAIPCALAGGALAHCHVLVTALMNVASSLGLQLQPVTHVNEPAQGAVRLARDAMLGRTVTDLQHS